MRELSEETGLTAEPVPVHTSGVGWAVFALEVPSDTDVTVDGTEHDRLAWVSYSQACARCRPQALLDSFTAGAAALRADTRESGGHGEGGA